MYVRTCSFTAARLFAGQLQQGMQHTLGRHAATLDAGGAATGTAAGIGEVHCEAGMLVSKRSKEDPFEGDQRPPKAAHHDGAPDVGFDEYLRDQSVLFLADL